MKSMFSRAATICLLMFSSQLTDQQLVQAAAIKSFSEVIADPKAEPQSATEIKLNHLQSMMDKKYQEL